MIDSKHFDDLAQKAVRSLPSGLQALKQDIESNLRAGLEAAVSRLDLVTREELQVQAGVLARTRQRLQQLEARVAELERHVDLAGGTEEG
jgi:BMFP domain-containing protein YqiC